MANYLKSADLGGHPHGGYAPPHAHHGAHGHGALPPGMPGMAGLPFGLPPGLEGVGFPQGMWGKFSCHNWFSYAFAWSYIFVLSPRISFAFLLVR